ncbi:MAG: hypothetical protein ABIG67_02165 [Pseudomonadota bacterium]
MVKTVDKRGVKDGRTNRAPSGRSFRITMLRFLPGIEKYNLKSVLYTNLNMALLDMARHEKLFPYRDLLLTLALLVLYDPSHPKGIPGCKKRRISPSMTSRIREKWFFKTFR